MSDMMIRNSLVKVKDKPPYLGDMEGKVLLNSLARASLDPKTGSYSFAGKLNTNIPQDEANVQAVSDLLSKGALSGDPIVGIGVDQELISAVPASNPTFINRNFTEAEVAYCQAQASPRSSFAARWAGKEAVFKSLSIASKGAASPMRDIEVINEDNGGPVVNLYGDTKAQADAKGISKVLISLSHSETVAIAFAQAHKKSA